MAITRAHPRFDRAVGAGGYAWWYVDAISDDGLYCLTMIVFIGSVFSPYYAWARRRGAAPADQHCAVNAVLYGPRGKRWAMTERGAGSLRRAPNALSIGPSSIHWDGDQLTIEIDEVTVPVPSRLRGTVRLYPAQIYDFAALLDPEGLHEWRPMAPSARVEVALEHPALSWSGSGYFDMNAGSVPLADSFVGWDWSRAKLAEGAAVLYDALRRDGSEIALALRFAPDGTVEHFEPPLRQPLPRTGWRIARTSRAEAGHTAKLQRTLEDTPFYARSLITTRLLGEDVTAVHESLSLDRFRQPWVQVLLPFRMPRRSR